MRGQKNPLARGAQVRVDAALYSAATGEAGFGSGGGAKGPQRFIFGYTGRHDYVDSNGNPWRPGTEFVTRLGFGADTVARCWWNRRRSMYIGGTRDEEIYRYGVHAPEFWVNLTAAPGEYLIRLHWADTPETPWVEREGKWDPVSRPTTVAINGKTVIEGPERAEGGGDIQSLHARVSRGPSPKRHHRTAVQVHSGSRGYDPSYRADPGRNDALRARGGLHRSLNSAL